MGGPRPSYGRAGNDVNQGRYEHGRLGAQGIGPNYLNSYTNLNPNSKSKSKSKSNPGPNLSPSGLCLTQKEADWRGNQAEKEGTNRGVPQWHSFMFFWSLIPQIIPKGGKRL